MPLMVDILIPFQNGKPIDYALVRLYLGGLLLSSALAWLLGWGRTYILARVSERIGADLRTRSEEHTSELQSLMRISYAVFCLKKKIKHTEITDIKPIIHLT